MGATAYLSWRSVTTDDAEWMSGKFRARLAQVLTETSSWMSRRRTLRIVVYRLGREHRRAQANRRFVIGRADLRAYYQARVAGKSDFGKKRRTVRPERAKLRLLVISPRVTNGGW